MQFSNALKDWRKRRGYSQERLGFEANVSSRHIAFIETGRARPSREMVIRLSEALDVPRAERNSLLEAAGFASVYSARSLDADDMQAIKEGMQWMLHRHQPFPAFAIDRHWNLLMLNATAQALLEQFGLKAGDSLLDAVLARHGLRTAIVNWTETAFYFEQRLRTESRHLGGDPYLTQIADQLAVENSKPNGLEQTLPAVLQTRYRAGDHVLSLYSTIAQFGSAEDIALADLRIEFLFPGDQATRDLLEAMFSDKA
jgi:transcriptional regulator with XRE-family HTH domain